MKKRNGFVSNSSSSSYTVSSTVSSPDCAWCECSREDCDSPVIYDGLFFCSMDCVNKYIEKEGVVEEEKKEEPIVEVARFELMDFE